MGSKAVDRFLEAVKGAGMAKTEAFADNAVSDSTVPNWRMQLHSGADIRTKYSAWFDFPSTISELRRTPLPEGELVEYTRTWMQNDVQHKGHHIHRFKIVSDRIVEDAHWCGGRWNDGILKEIATAGHKSDNVR